MEELQISEIEATFTALVKQWREETFGISSTNQMSMHPAYQQIIGMGKPVRAAEDDETWWWPDQFYWPLSVPREETIEAFQQAFETLGYEVCQGDVLQEGLQRIAIYANSNKVPTHIARQLPTGKLTSKLGSLEDIEHNNLQGLTGNPGYGEIACIMKKLISV